MFLEGKKVILRDFIASDIDDRIHWETVETEWLDWDAPWENEEAPFDEKEYRERKLKTLATQKEDEKVRLGFEICVKENQKHIGWVNVYWIDDTYTYSSNGHHLTIGIGIPPLLERRKGYATDAWITYINYLLKNEITNVYTQTWSGNERVMGLMNKLGFTEVHRKTGNVAVNQQSYDSLTFKLDMELYQNLLVKYGYTT